MNPVVNTTPVGPRSPRTASAARERHDESGFDLALGAAAAAHAARPATAPPEPRESREREAVRPQSEEPSGGARRGASQEAGASDNDAGPQEAAPAGSVARDGVRVTNEPAREPARDGASAQTRVTADATSTVGTEAQNASSPPPVVAQGASTAPAFAAALANSAASPQGPASASLPLSLPAGATTTTITTPGPALPATPATAAPQAPAPQAAAADPRQPIGTLVPGAGDGVVRVLSMKEGSRPVRGPVAIASTPADAPREASPPRAADAPPEPAPMRAPNTPMAGPAVVAVPGTVRFAREGAEATLSLATPLDPAPAPAGEAARGAARPLPPEASATPRPVQGSGPATAPAAGAPEATRSVTTAAAPGSMPVSSARATEALAARAAEPAAEPAPAKQAPTPSAAPVAPAVRGEGASKGDGHGDGATRRQGGGTPSTDTGEAAGSPATAVSVDASRSTKPGDIAITRGSTTPAATASVEDPRLEPMRRAADQVTLKFDGEDGLEGRLRITVRGDSVRASILSSHEGTLERLGGELGTLRRALTEQGFTSTRVAVHDTRGTEANGASDTRQHARDGEERRQGEPQRRPGQGRESRQGGGSEQGRRGPQEERRTE